MEGLDFAAYWIGYAVMVTGGFGAFCGIAIWSINKALALTGFSRIIIQAYARILDEKRRKRNIPA